MRKVIASEWMSLDGVIQLANCASKVSFNSHDATNNSSKKVAVRQNQILNFDRLRVSAKRPVCAYRFIYLFEYTDLLGINVRMFLAENVPARLIDVQNERQTPEGVIFDGAI